VHELGVVAVMLHSTAISSALGTAPAVREKWFLKKRSLKEQSGDGLKGDKSLFQ